MEFHEKMKDMCQRAETNSKEMEAQILRYEAQFDLADMLGVHVSIKDKDILVKLRLQFDDIEKMRLSLNEAYEQLS